MEDHGSAVAKADGGDAKSSVEGSGYIGLHLTAAIRAAMDPDTDYEALFGSNFPERMAALLLAKGVVSEKAAEFAWLIEAPGQHYLSARELGRYEFYWTTDHALALRFCSRTQADLAASAIRELDAALFAFAATLGDARPVEHAWIAKVTGEQS